MATTIIDKSIPEIGYFSRIPTPGPEFDMVNKYIDFIANSDNRRKRAVFVEPKILTGFPDLVIVEYTTSTKNGWNNLRLNLNDTDLKILFEIDRLKKTDLTNLLYMLGYNKKELEKTLKKLEFAELIKTNGDKVQKISRRNYCSVKKIISIEAKIDKWSEAINQAYRNNWFASESYIMLNKDKCTETIKNKCSELGVGIILVNGSVEVIKKSRTQEFPVSYSSFQFEEWLQRYFNHKAENNEQNGINEKVLIGNPAF